MTLNEGIRALRRDRGMTQEQLAEAMNVSAAAVSKWENGQSVPDIAVLTALADYFEVSLDALVGYTVKSRRREDMVRSIRTLKRHKQYGEALRQAEEALRRYPNCFQVVYEAGRAYGSCGMEHERPDDLRSALCLMERARTLMSQNTDPTLREESLWTLMGLYHASLGDREQAIRCYEVGNVAGMNDVSIGNNRAMLGQYDEALPMLTGGLVGAMIRMFNAGTGTLRCLIARRELAEAEELTRWLLHVLDGMEASDGSYVLKMKTIVHAWAAVVFLLMGSAASAEKQLQQAAICARAFDAAPDFRLRGIRFYRGGDEALSDSMGETAMDSLRRVLAAYPAVKDALLGMLDGMPGA